MRMMPTPITPETMEARVVSMAGFPVLRAKFYQR